MKTLANILMAIGIALVFIGGAGMDADSVLVPAIMAFAGVGIMYAGWSIKEMYV